jgi:integrase
VRVARKPKARGRRGQGSITQVPGGYLARWSRTEGGVRHRVAKTFILRGDAEWWLGQAQRHGVAPDDPTVAEHMEAWLRSKRRIAPSTRTQYREHVELHIVPVIGGFRLADLRQRHIEAFVEDRLRHESKGKPLSPSTVGKILVTLRSALQTAVPRTIPDNPAAKVEAPTVKRVKVEAMTLDAAATILASVRGTWLEHITRTLLGSGMRLGEALALNQGDVHEGYVSLRESKTTIRAVRLSLDADRAIHEAIAAAPRRGPKEPVFFGPRTGDRMLGSSVTHALKATAGLSPHRLRHGVATLMVARGVPMRRVAEQLGHANPNITARVYAHVAPESMIDDLLVLDEAVK